MTSTGAEYADMKPQYQQYERIMIAIRLAFHGRTIDIANRLRLPSSRISGFKRLIKDVDHVTDHLVAAGADPQNLTVADVRSELGKCGCKALKFWNDKMIGFAMESRKVYGPPLPGSPQNVPHGRNNVNKIKVLREVIRELEEEDAKRLSFDRPKQEVRFCVGPQEQTLEYDDHERTCERD